MDQRTKSHPFLRIVDGEVSLEDIIFKENELLFAVLQEMPPTAAHSVDFCFHRREVITGRHLMCLHLFIAEMAKHFCKALWFKLNLCVSQRICDQYVVLCLDGNARDGHCVPQCLKECTVRTLSCVVTRHLHPHLATHPFIGHCPSPT